MIILTASPEPVTIKTPSILGEPLVHCGFTATHHSKDALVNVGLYALSRGEWRMVAAITTLIARKGWRDA